MSNALTVLQIKFAMSACAQTIGDARKEDDKQSAYKFVVHLALQPRPSHCPKIRQLGQVVWKKLDGEEVVKEFPDGHWPDKVFPHL